MNLLIPKGYNLDSLRPAFFFFAENIDHLLIEIVGPTDN